jgi:hypothetical protein
VSGETCLTGLRNREGAPRKQRVQGLKDRWRPEVFQKSPAGHAEDASSFPNKASVMG